MVRRFIMFKKICLIFLLALACGLPAGGVLADARSSRYGLTDAAQGNLPAGEGARPSESLAIEAGRIVGTLLAFLGVIFLVLMIAGGIMWMTAAGNDARVATARRLIIAAIIGLIIVVSAYAITTFIADNLLAGSSGSSTASSNTASTGGCCYVAGTGNPPTPPLCVDAESEEACTGTYAGATFYQGQQCSAVAGCP